MNNLTSPKFLCVGLAILFAGATGCVSESKKTVASPTFVSEKGGEFHDRDHGLVVYVPGNWERQTLSENGFILLAPASSRSKVIRTRPNVSILSDPIPQTPTSKEYFISSGQGLMRLERGYRMVKEGEMKVGSFPFYWRIYYHDVNGFEAISVQYSSIVNGKPIAIVATSAPDDYDLVRPEFDRIVRSIRFE